MPDRFKPHNYLDTLAERWVEWTGEYLTQQPVPAIQPTGFEALLYPGNPAPPADGRSRATEMYKYGLLRGRLTPPQARSEAIGWQLLCAGEHVHTPLGYLEWLLNQEWQNLPPAVSQAQSALAALLTSQWYVELSQGPRITYITVFEWLKQKLPRPANTSHLTWLQTLAAAIFCTTYTIPASDALLTDLIADASVPRLSLVWLDGRTIALTNNNLINNLITSDDFDELKPARSLNYWIGKAPEPRGNYSLAERSAAQFMAAFAAEEIQLLRQDATATPEPFRSLLYKNPNQEAPDIIGLLPELVKLPALTQPTLHLMKTLREGAIEAVQQLYGADAVAEIKPQDHFSPPPLPASFPHQKIFFGPPGTGKSTQVKKATAGYQTARTTFHPDTDYGSFVGAYKPVKDGVNITYDFRPQVFAQAYWQAWQQYPQPYFLLIEEINRGNCAQIFGDLFQTLDRGAAGYSEYAGRADADLAHWLRAQLTAAAPTVREHYAAALAQAGTPLNAPIEAGDWVLLPNNLYLYATMNTSDQSLFPMDSAFKRRWAWEYVPIEYDQLRGTVLDLGAAGRYDWVAFLTRVNASIQDFTESEDKQLGPWFVPPRGGEVSRAEFCDKVMFYLWSDIYKLDPAREGSIFRFRPGAGLPEQPFTFANLYGPEADTYLRSFMTDTLAVPPPNSPATTATEVPEPASDAPEEEAPGA